MLLIFTFSITPKKYLHHLIADHTDYCTTASGEKATVTQWGYNCHYDDLVVSSPFVESTPSATFFIPAVYKIAPPPVYTFYFLRNNTTTDLRGPPAAV